MTLDQIATDLKQGTDEAIKGFKQMQVALIVCISLLTVATIILIFKQK